MKKLICNEVARSQAASLRKKLFHTSCFMYFAFIFSECITNTSSKGGLKVCECNFFRRKVILLVIYLFNYDSPKSIIFMLNMAFDDLLSASTVAASGFSQQQITFSAKSGMYWTEAVVRRCSVKKVFLEISPNS